LSPLSDSTPLSIILITLVRKELVRITPLRLLAGSAP
jgi:hypothetical protein